jgi:hypothetical protein
MLDFLESIQLMAVGIALFRENKQGVGAQG